MWRPPLAQPDPPPSLPGMTTVRVRWRWSPVPVYVIPRTRPGLRARGAASTPGVLPRPFRSGRAGATRPRRRRRFPLLRSPSSLSLSLSLFHASRLFCSFAFLAVRGEEGRLIQAVTQHTTLSSTLQACSRCPSTPTPLSSAQRSGSLSPCRRLVRESLTLPLRRGSPLPRHWSLLERGGPLQRGRGATRQAPGRAWATSSSESLPPQLLLSHLQLEPVHGRQLNYSRRRSDSWPRDWLDGIDTLTGQRREDGTK